MMRCFTGEVEFPDKIRSSSDGQISSKVNFRVADYPGVDTLFVNTSAFLGTYLVRLPTSGLLALFAGCRPLSIVLKLPH